MKSTTSLGACIRLERKRAGLTQEQLGERVGLKASRISKIENGAPITPEVASFILGKMGSELELKVVSSKKDDRSVTDFLISVVHHFSLIKGITLAHAFRYLKTFKGLDFLLRYKDIEQTLSYEDITHNVSAICAKHGGAL